MKKKKIKTLVIILILIAIVVGLILILTRPKEKIKRLTNLYNDLNMSQMYLFEMQKSENEKTIMAKKENKTIIDDYTENTHTTTIVKDDNTYLVLHDKQEYYIYGQNNVVQTILTDGLQEVISKDFSTGTEKVKGKKYLYEEYQGSTMFMEASSLEVNEEDIKTRFYFDDNNDLAYIRTIKGVHQELLKIDIQKEVDDSIFEIPSNYAEN